MEIKINGIVSPEIRNVIIDPENKLGTSNKHYGGRIIADNSFLFDLVGSEPFKLEVGERTYLVCTVESSSTGQFSYFRKG
ncbi:MAG: hypothetical protein ABI378_09510 [Chitinophagaceae bacterium]